MSEPLIVCPRCNMSIKLNESLAAPLLEATRRDFEQRLTLKDAEIAGREKSMVERESAVAQAQDAIDREVRVKMEAERARIAAAEGKKVRLELGEDLAQKTKDLADLTDLLKQRDLKLAEARTAQADLIRQKRELDDAKREMSLTIEQRVQTSVAEERERMSKEADSRLAAKLQEKDQALTAMGKQLGLAAKRELEIQSLEAQVQQERAAIGKKVAEQLAQERTKITAEEALKAKVAANADIQQKGRELSELKEILKQRDVKLAEAQQAQAAVLRKERELDDARREMALTVEKQIQEGLAKARDAARKEAEEHLTLKLSEREQTINAMTRQIEELKRKAEQGSQQLQGEVQELQLERMLSAKFTHDTIEPVLKGEHGGDILQRIMLPVGTSCGTILWESKRTRNWSDGWLPKLRDDQRSAKAEIAVIVSTALPKGIDTFDHIDGIWITHPRAVLPVALALRQMLVEVNGARQSSEGQQTKMAMIYQYLTGPKFRLRVQAIVEAFTTMGDDLQREKKAIQRQWAKREEQIERVLAATAGMYGELQGIAGKNLLEIDGLEFPALPSPEDRLNAEGAEV